MRRLVISIAIAAAITIGVVSYATFALQPTVEPVKQSTVQVSKAPTVQELMDAVNAERAKVGVAPLTIDTRLNQSAQVKADDMIANNYYAHVDKNGKHGYAYAYDYDPDCKRASENIVYGGSGMTTSRAMTSWKGSKAHYEAMVNPAYTTTGFGIQDTVIVEHFCKP